MGRGKNKYHQYYAVIQYMVYKDAVECIFMVVVSQSVLSCVEVHTIRMRR